MIKLYCNKCGCETWHSKEWYCVRSEYFNEELELEDISEYGVYECNNCGEYCFTHVYLFKEGSEEVDRTFDRYPKSIDKIKKVKNLEAIPNSICKIYDETYTAILNECYILAMIGIRSIVEAIARKENINGNKKKKLNELISDMKNDGLIGKKEEELLQIMRKTGNSTIHEIVNPDKEILLRYFDIINNVLEKLYCFTL